MMVDTKARPPMMRKNMPMVTDPSKMLDLSNYLYGFAALLTLLATFGVIYFGRTVSNLKDAQVKQYQKDADVRIATSNQQAADALQKAAEAHAQVADVDATAQ